LKNSGGVTPCNTEKKRKRRKKTRQKSRRASTWGWSSKKILETEFRGVQSTAKGGGAARWRGTDWRETTGKGKNSSSGNSFEPFEKRGQADPPKGRGKNGESKK